jgi:hypothetical protein
MKWRMLAFMPVAGFALATSGAEAQMPGAASRADLRLYAAGVWSSPWLETQAGTTFGTGLNPGFGGSGSYWFTPRLGARLQLGFIPSDLPQPSTAEPFGPGGPPPTTFAGPVDNWLYDLSLAFRPFARPGQARSAVSSLYLFLGGGGFTADPPYPGDCVAAYTFGNACLATRWRDSTVPQLTAGAGATLLPVTRSLGLFTEVAGNVFSSPFQTGDFHACDRPECMTQGRTVAAVRLAGGVVLAFGQPRPAPARTAPPPPAAAPAAPVGPPAPPAAEGEPIRVCAVVAGIPRYLEAFVQAPGDTIVITEQGIRRPLRSAHPMPAPTASGQDWFTRGESVFFAAQEYVPTGAPRHLEPLQLQRIGHYQAVPLFALREAVVPPAAVFVPVRDGCTFQAYQLRPRGTPRR